MVSYLHYFQQFSLALNLLILRLLGMITAGSKQDFSVSFAPTEAKVTISTAVFNF